MRPHLLNWTALLYKKIFILVHHVYKLIWLTCFNFDSIYDAPREITPSNYRAKLGKYRAERAEQAEAKLHAYFGAYVVIAVFFFAVNLGTLAKYKFDYFGNSMPESWIHLMYPEEYFRQGDMLICDCNLGFFFCSLFLWRRKWLQDKYAMYLVYGTKEDYYLIVDGQVWDRENAEKIVQSRLTAQRYVVPICIISWNVGYFYFSASFMGKNDMNIEHNVFIFGFLPILVWCWMLNILQLLYHFFAATRYTLIKQAYLRRLMKELLAKLRDPKARRQAGFHRLWSEFFSLNKHLAYQCNEIFGYNHFWSHLLSALFCCEIGDLVYLLYGTFFNESSTVELLYNIFYMLEMAALLCAVIYRCSLVDYNNDKFYAGNVSACIRFQKHFKLSPKYLIHIEKIATNRGFSKACFRLSNGYRLDSTAFNMVVYIVSTFFLTVCRRNRRNAAFTSRFDKSYRV